MLIRFLREDEVKSAFRRMRRKASSVMVAAPFWGDGAADMLDLQPGDRVLCRIDAPGCNPIALAQAIDRGVKMKSHPRLHAKIYATAAQVIVGSSNPSRYGIVEEGEVARSSLEANILTDDSTIVEHALGMFDELWKSPESSRITSATIRREIERRAAEPLMTPSRDLSGLTLLAACSQAPELFKSVYVVSYNEDLGEGGKEALHQLRRQAVGAPLAASDFRNAWAYQLSAPPPGGSWLVDLDCRGKRQVRGTSRIPAPILRLKVANEHDLIPTLRGSVNVPGVAGAFKISLSEKAQLISIADRLLDFDNPVPLAKVMHLLG